MAQDKFSLGLTDPFAEEQKYGFQTEPINFDFDMPDVVDENEEQTKEERKAAKKAAREARIAAGGNPKAWKNMSKGQKATTVLMMVAGSLMAGGNPAFGFAMRSAEKQAAQKRIDKLDESKKDRAHDLVKIAAETEGAKEVTKLGGEIQTEQIAQRGDIQMSVLDREWDYRATAQSNQNAFDGDQALTKIFGEKMLQEIRIQSEERRHGSTQTHQTSLAMLQARRDQVRLLEQSLLEALPGSQLSVLDYIGRLEPYIVNSGALPSYTPEMVEALEQVGRDRDLKRSIDLDSARLENLNSARQILALSTPKGETILAPSDPRFAFIQGLAGNVNSLSTPEESSVAAASLLASPRGQQLNSHLATLFTRPAVPSLTDVDVLASEIANMDVPLNPVAARELLFQTGAEPDAVDARIPLPDGYLDPDPLDRSPGTTVEKRKYGHYIEPALEAADYLDKEFSRALRIWLDKNGTGDYKTDYAQLWRIIKHYQTSDESFRRPLMNYLLSGKSGVLSTTDRLDMTTGIR